MRQRQRCRRPVARSPERLNGLVDITLIKQIAALLERADRAQAVVSDAVLARYAAKVLTARDAVARLRLTGSTANLIERAAAEAHDMGFDRILFSRTTRRNALSRTNFDLIVCGEIAQTAG